MAEEKAKEEQRTFSIQRIYVKDVSFETPNSPDIFRSQWKPENNLNINTSVKSLGDDAYEVVLTLTLTTKQESLDVVPQLLRATGAEVQQAGIFTIKGFSDQERGPMLGSYCPNVLFAYAREVITDLVTKGSFPQIILQPINFDALYMQQAQQAASQNAPSAGETTVQ